MRKKRNCFEKFIYLTKVVNVLLIFVFAGCIAMIVCGIVFGDHELHFPNMWLLMPGIFVAMLCLMGSLMAAVFRYSTRVVYNTAKQLLSEDEIDAIERVSFLNTAIMAKAQRLQKECAEKNDMTEYNNYMQIVAITGFSRTINTYRFN